MIHRLEHFTIARAAEEPRASARAALPWKNLTIGCFTGNREMHQPKACVYTAFGGGATR